jgi:hypothetical protein
MSALTKEKTRDEELLAKCPMLLARKQGAAGRLAQFKLDKHDFFRQRQEVHQRGLDELHASGASKDEIIETLLMLLEVATEDYAMLKALTYGLNDELVAVARILLRERQGQAPKPHPTRVK